MSSAPSSDRTFNNPRLQEAIRLARLGWAILPLFPPLESGRCSCGNQDCDSPGKHPIGKLVPHGLTDASSSESKIGIWWLQRPDANIGAVVPEDHVVVDVDGPEGEAALKEAGCHLRPTAIGKTGRGNHFIYRTKEKIRPKIAVLPHVDLRGPGSYIVCPPSRHASGVDYEWAVRLGDVELEEVPEAIVKLYKARGNGAKPHLDTASVLAGVPAGRRDHDLFRLASKLRRADVPREEAEKLVVEAAARSEQPPGRPFTEKDARAKVAGAYTRYEPAPFPQTDAGNGELIAHLYGERLRYDHRAGRWLLWTEHRWAPDATEVVRQLAKAAARQRYRDGETITDKSEKRAAAKWAIDSESRGRIEAALVQARTEEPVADSGDRWDADPMLLGCVNGIVHLKLRKQ